MKELISQTLRDVGPGRMSSLAYDTAWVARLGEIDQDLSNHALNWLCENQLSDGCWGAEYPFYYHDRVASTLAAMVALTYRGKREKDRNQIEKGLLALERITSGATLGLGSDSNGATVGFEMVMPTLVDEAERLGIIKQQGDRILGRISNQRKIKLELLKGKKISRHISAAFSSEMAGLDGQHMLDIENLQESNGSIGHSPSATAYYASSIKIGDEAALSYLRKFRDASGGMPDLIPFDIFEACWVLWNFSFIKSWDREILDLFTPLLNSLKSSWVSGKGIGLSRGYSIPDGDDTAFVFDVLARLGSPLDIETVLAFEEPEHFRTYHYETNSSISVNIHVLGALRQAGIKRENLSAQKVLGYLKKSQISNAYWFDKWNISAYYTTAHAILACAGYADELIESSVEWLLATQQKNGAWGDQIATAEETAYCLQALLIWSQQGKKVPKESLTKAAVWLKDHVNPPYPPLWIGKGLYTPELVVQSAILSSLIMFENRY